MKALLETIRNEYDLPYEEFVVSEKFNAKKAQQFDRQPEIDGGVDNDPEYTLEHIIETLEINEYCANLNKHEDKEAFLTQELIAL